MNELLNKGLYASKPHDYQDGMATWLVDVVN